MIPFPLNKMPWIKSVLCFNNENKLLHVINLISWPGRKLNFMQTICKSLCSQRKQWSRRTLLTHWFFLQNKQKTTKQFDWRHGTLNKHTHVSCKYKIMENCAHWSSEYLVVIQRTVFVQELVWLQQVWRLAGIVAS